MLQAVRRLADVERQADGPIEITLLELVSAVADSADSDAEVVATVAHLLNSGRVTLVGNFRGADVRVG